MNLSDKSMPPLKSCLTGVYMTMRNKIRTLIADDDAIILRGMKKFIDWEQYGFEIVATAADGRALLELCREQEIDVVITDIEMPKMNGLEMMRALRENNKEIKIVVISGFDKFEYAKEAIQHGVSYYLLKPINPVELVGVLNRLREEFSGTQVFRAQEQPKQMNIEQIVRLVKEKIDHNEDKDISLEYIQEHYYVNLAYFSRAFKEIVGIPFTRYRQNHKMRYAAFLLEHTNCRLYEIAEKLDYEDERYFSRVFKKHYGMTPREWREQKR